MTIKHGTVESYAPLVLDYHKKWALVFQQEPTPEIILMGDEPTRDEIIECLSGIQAPVWFIAVCEIAAAVAKKEKYK